MTQAVLLVSCICNVVFPALAVTALALSKQLVKRCILYGLAQYALTRVIVSLATSALRLTGLTAPMMAVATAVLLAGLCVGAKLLMYRHAYRVATVGEAASAGLGEALVEVFFVTSADALNKAAYGLAIANGTLAEQLGPTYTPEMVDALVASFQGGGLALALFGALSCLIVIALQVSVARLIGKGGRGVALALLVALMSCVALYVLPQVSYLAADIAIVLVVVGLCVVELVERSPRTALSATWQL